MKRKENHGQKAPEGKGVSFDGALTSGNGVRPIGRHVGLMRGAGAPDDNSGDNMGGTEKRQVLYVDDSVVEREVVRGLLEAEGFEVMTTGDVEAALRLAEKRRPDLVLLDLHMPEKVGGALVEELRKVPGLEHTPVVALSASIRERDRAEVMAHFDGFIKKPVDPDIFPLMVREFIASGRLEENPAGYEQVHEDSSADGAGGASAGPAGLEEVLQTLEEIRSVMSHDLRTPLTVIISYAGTLGREKAGPLNEQQKAMLETVVEHGFKLDAMITDLVRRARETLDRHEYPDGKGETRSGL